MAISAYFMVGSRFKIQRAVSVWKTAFFYVAVYFVLNLFLKFKPMTFQDVKELIFPFSYEAYWYVTAYIIIILLSPFLNLLIKKMEQRIYKALLIILFILTTVPRTLLPGSKPFAAESHVLLFIFVYLFIGYYKKGYLGDKVKLAGKLAIIGLVLMVLSGTAVVLIVNVLNKPSLYEYATVWMIDESIPMLMLSLGVAIKVFEKEPKEIKFINAISKGSFDVYLLHMNHIIYMYLWTKVVPVQTWAKEAYFIPASLLAVIAIYVVTLFIGNIRCRVSAWLEKKIRFKWLENIYGKINTALTFEDK